jgi:Alginate lyase
MDLVKNELLITFWSTIRQSLTITSEKMANTNYSANFAAVILLVIAVCSGINAAVKGERQAPSQTSLAPIPTDAPNQWVHPGVFVQSKQLDYISEKVAEKAEPWSGAFTSMLTYDYASPTRTPTPFKTVDCGPRSNPDIGCHEERQDSMAAYVNSLAFWITKENNYAEKAIEYMDAWSGTIQSHTNHNAPLQSAWSAANWVRAGEIMRYANGGWSDQGIAIFEDMLRNVYLPEISRNSDSYNGNWELGTTPSSLRNLQTSHKLAANHYCQYSHDRGCCRNWGFPGKRHHLYRCHVQVFKTSPSLHLSYFGRPKSHFSQ